MSADLFLVAVEGVVDHAEDAVGVLAPASGLPRHVGVTCRRRIRRVRFVQTFGGPWFVLLLGGCRWILSRCC